MLDREPWCPYSNQYSIPRAHILNRHKIKEMKDLCQFLPQTASESSRGIFGLVSFLLEGLCYSLHRTSPNTRRTSRGPVRLIPKKNEVCHLNVFLTKEARSKGFYFVQWQRRREYVVTLE